MGILALHIRGLMFSYGGTWSLRVGELSLAPGEQVLLAAGSGRGKSTLLQLIAGLLEPSEGVVEVNGRSVHALRGAARDRFRGRHVGMIFQTFNLLQGFSAEENVEAALMFSEAAAGRVRQGEALKLLASLGIERPGARVEELSIGQQQRVAVARAVAPRPELVLADEPTASLDPENAGGAMDVIQGACRERGAALLCVSHDPSMAARFERRIRLEDLA